MKESLILVYGDSMCMPSATDKIAAGEAYPELLADYQATRGLKARVYNRAGGGRTIDDHWKRFNDEKNFFAPGPDDLLIIHAGMVDCAPRPLPQKWRRRLERQPKFIREPIVAFLKKNRPYMLKKGFIFYKIDPPQFKQRIEEWLAVATKFYRSILVVPIVPISQAGEDHSPGWRQNVVLYNRILADAVARHSRGIFYVPLHAELAGSEEKFKECISPSDGYHLSKKGHQLVRDLIVEYLERQA